MTVRLAPAVACYHNYSCYRKVKCLIDTNATGVSNLIPFTCLVVPVHRKLFQSLFNLKITHVGGKFFCICNAFLFEVKPCYSLLYRLFPLLRVCYKILQIRGAFNNLSTWVRKKQFITEKYFLFFNVVPQITQYTLPTFVATTISPWKKKSFDCSSNQVVTASLTSSWLENRLPRRNFFITRNRK